MNVQYLYLVVGSGFIALLFAMYKSAWVNKQDPGNIKMREISAAIREGAMAFLKREYRVLAIFILAVASLLFFGYSGNLRWVAASFVLGAICSAAAGFFGMRIATAANTRR